MAKNKNKLIPTPHIIKAKKEANDLIYETHKRLARISLIEIESQATGIDLLEFGNNWLKAQQIFKKHGVTEKTIKTARVLYGVKRK